MHRLRLAAAMLCCSSAIAFAQTRSPIAEDASAIKWGPAPAVLPAGARMAVLDGNPMGNGVFTVRLSVPPGYRILPHWHPTDEIVTVISGAISVGMGDKFETAKGITVHAGGFGMLPAQMRHYAWFKGRTVIQIHGQGPFVINYVNAADAPRAR